jgi:hypothetical protein
VKEPPTVFEEITMCDESCVVPAGHILYKGGSPDTPSGERRFHWVVESSSPVDVFVVPSQSDYALLRLQESFIHYPSLRGYDILKYDREGTIDRRGGIVVSNDSEQDATVRIRVSYYISKIP